MDDLKILRYIATRRQELERYATQTRLAAAAKAGSPERKRLTRTYYLIQILFWLSVSLPAALTVLLVEARGLSLAQIGLVMGVYALTVVAFEVPSGVLADMFGRKRVALSAYALLLTSQIALLFAFTLPLFFVFAVLNGAGRAFASGALEAWFIDRLYALNPNADIQPPLAKAGSFELLALTAGTVIGSLLPNLFPNLPAEGTAVLTPFSTTLVAALGVTVILFISVIGLVKEDATAYKGSRASLNQFKTIVKEAVVTARANQTVLLLFAAASLFGFALAGVETFWQPRFAELIGDTNNTFGFGVILAGSFLIAMLGNLASIPLCNLFKQRYARVAMLLQMLFGGLLMVLALQPNVYGAASVFWLVYFCNGALGSPVATLLNNEIEKAQRSSLLSARSLANYLGFFLGNLGLGFVAEQISIPAAWLVAGSVGFMGFVFFLRIDSLHVSQPVSTSVKR